MLLTKQIKANLEKKAYFDVDETHTKVSVV